MSGVPANKSSANNTVLVVDDNLMNLTLAYELLTAEGYEVLRANNAEIAIQILETSKPFLILMDIALPGKDGLTLTRELKSDPRTKEIFIIAVTASAMKGDKEKIIRAGCDDYLSKPIDTRALIKRVKEIMEKSV